MQPLDTVDVKGQASIHITRYRYNKNNIHLRRKPNFRYAPLIWHTHMKVYKKKHTQQAESVLKQASHVGQCSVTKFCFLWEAGNLNINVRKILNGGYLTLRLLTWNHWNGTQNDGKRKLRNIKLGFQCVLFYDTMSPCSFYKIKHSFYWNMN